MLQSTTSRLSHATSQATQTIHMTHSEMIKLKYRGALIAMLGSFAPDYMVTLTFRRKIKRDLFDKIIKDFTFRLHNTIYGDKSEKAVSAYLCCEYKTSTNLHLHMLIKDPMRTMSAARLEMFNVLKNPLYLSQIIRRCWIEAGEQYGRITGDPKKTSRQSEWFQTVDDPFEAAEYCTKEVKYGNEDLINWMYSTPKGRRHRNKRSPVTH